jgi:hypothetical protein
LKTNKHLQLMGLVVEELVVEAEAVMLLVVEAEANQAAVLLSSMVAMAMATLHMAATAALDTPAAVIITTTITTGTTDAPEHQDVLFF